MSLVKTVFLQPANFLLFFFSLVNDMTMTGIVVRIFLLLSPAHIPKARHKIWECPTRLIPSFQSLKLKPSQWELIVYEDVYFLTGKEMTKKQVVSSQEWFLWFFRKQNALRNVLLLKLPIHVRWLVFSTDYYTPIKCLWKTTGLHFFCTSVITWDCFIKLNFIMIFNFSSRNIQSLPLTNRYALHSLIPPLETTRRVYKPSSSLFRWVKERAAWPSPKYSFVHLESFISTSGREDPSGTLLCC